MNQNKPHPAIEQALDSLPAAQIVVCALMGLALVVAAFQSVLP